MKFNCCISCINSISCHEFKDSKAIIFCKTIKKKIIEKFYCKFWKGKK